MVSHEGVVIYGIWHLRKEYCIIQEGRAHRQEVYWYWYWYGKVCVSLERALPSWPERR